MPRSDDIATNPFAAPETDLTPDLEQASFGQAEYAGFWQRFIAAFVDGIILQVIVLVISVVVSMAVITPDNDNAIVLYFGSQFIQFIVAWLYMVLQESSESRATLGKKLLGLQVVTMTGERLSFGQATKRYFGKILSILPLFIGYLIQPFTEKKQALHDILAGALVVKAHS